MHEAFARLCCCKIFLRQIFTGRSIAYNDSLRGLFEIGLTNSELTCASPRRFPGMLSQTGSAYGWFVSNWIKLPLYVSNPVSPVPGVSCVSFSNFLPEPSKRILTITGCFCPYVNVDGMNIAPRNTFSESEYGASPAAFWGKTGCAGFFRLVLLLEFSPVSCPLATTLRFCPPIPWDTRAVAPVTMFVDEPVLFGKILASRSKTS